MDVPVKDITYSIWDPTEHKQILCSYDERFAIRYYQQHARKDVLELWKITTTTDGWYEHSKLA
jgi:hypothetical protein